MPKPCSICSDPDKRAWVDAQQALGFSSTAMETRSREWGRPMKQETILRHVRHLQTSLPVTTDPREVAPNDATQPKQDVATLVQAEVVKKLNDGTARVTVQHGLQAQQLIDRRLERQKDRELAVTLARLLHSPSPPPRLVHGLDEDEVIELDSVRVG
jgi:hypothetical protein